MANWLSVALLPANPNVGDFGGLDLKVVNRPGACLQLRSADRKASGARRISERPASLHRAISRQFSRSIGAVFRLIHGVEVMV